MQSGVSLLIPVLAEDSQLSQYSQYVEQFSQTWGDQYVHFSAEFRDDDLKEKSYKYGVDGYVTMGKFHWLFNE